ncbi:vitronectin b [Eucyclogobius newberryi]|uniref:vitronectin b n=1 Tax=Eucyclogobius newberryi TaxID=166745 RepID=UPI003B5B2D17
MKPAVVLLLGLVVLVRVTFAAEESCAQRCGSFNPGTKCQCDSLCAYYGSCCPDYEALCPKKVRGDTFDEDVLPPQSEPPPTQYAVPPTESEAPPTFASAPVMDPTHRPTEVADPNATTCSGRAFDAFLQLKNGSIYAFRGQHFFELDETSVLPGYPKLIEDVWGMPGPVDAAFTRINCQGKTYIFKGNRYWRFDGDVLDEDYPRDVSIGFDGVPGDIDAAFAVPAPSHRGKEKAYFFKDDKYYQYEFKHQPSHEECVAMTRSSPSLLFTRYTDLFCDHSFENMFGELFGAPSSSAPSGPRLISQDWVGLSYPVDAAMVGRVKLTPKPTPPPVTVAKRHGYKKRRPNKKRGSRRTRHAFIDELFDGLFDDLLDYSDYLDYTDHSSAKHQAPPRQEQTKPVQTKPVQNVYFFKKDKYTRVDLKRKRVDSVIPPYPRSIAKYWLGCESEQTPDNSRAEK